MLNEFNVKYVKNNLLTVDMVNRIIKLKDQHWHYSEDSHKKWMEENLGDEEYHLWLENNSGEIFAYLNIVYLQIQIDSSIEDVIGIGNVCVDKEKSGKGIGILLMQICNYYISCHEKIAILLCKKKLTKFYIKSGWIEYPGDVIFKGNKYDELLMFNRLPKGTIIRIERNF